MSCATAKAVAWIIAAVLLGGSLLATVWAAWQEPVFYGAVEWTLCAGGLGLFLVGWGLVESIALVRAAAKGA